MSLEKETVVVNPMRIPEVGVASDLLSTLLKIDREDLYNRILMARSVGRFGERWEDAINRPRAGGPDGLESDTVRNGGRDRD